MTVMSLLRQCGRHLQTFMKSRVTGQVGLIRPRMQITTKLGYVTVRRLSLARTDFQQFDVLVNVVDEEQKYDLHKLEKTVLSICLDAKKKRVQYDELLYVVENYRSFVDKLDEQTSLIFLQCCGEMLPDVQPAVRHSLMERVWNLVQLKSEKLTVEHYNVMLNSLTANGRCVILQEFLKRMTVKPNVETYHSLLKMFANKGDSVTLDEIIKIMQDLNIETISNPVYEALIHCQLMNGHLNNALVYFEVMESYNLKASRETMKIFTCGYARMGKLENITKLLKACIYTDKDIMEIVKVVSMAGHGEHIPTVLKFLPDSVDDNNPEITNTVIELVNSNRIEDAAKILIELSSKNTYDFIKEMFQVKTTDEIIIKIVNELSKINKISALHAAKFASQSANESLMYSLFQLMKNYDVDIKPEFYWPLFVKFTATEGERAIFSILQHMATMNVKADYKTLCNYVIPYINTIEPVIAYKKCEKYAESKSVVLNAFLSAFLSEAKFRQALLILKSFQGKPDYELILKSLHQGYEHNKNVEHYAAVLELLDNNRLPSKFIQQFVNKNIEYIENSDDESKTTQYFKFIKKVKLLIRAFRKHDLKVSVFVADDIVENLFSKVDDAKGEQIFRVLFKGILEGRNLNSYTDDDVLFQQSEPDVDEGIYSNNINVLKRSLLLHCRDNNLRKAEEIKDKIDDLRIKWSPVMHASMLQLYSRHEMVLEALLHFRSLKNDHSNFVIDDRIILSYATALATKNRMNDAIEVIMGQVNLSMAEQNEHNCRHLLKAVAHNASSERTEEILDILISKEYCKIQNFILEPVIQSYLARNDILGAVQTLKRFAEKYQLTPFNTELMMHMCKKWYSSEKYSKMLSEIYKTVKTIEGDQEANVNLIIAATRAKNKHCLVEGLKMVSASGGFCHTLTVLLRKSFNALPLEEKAEAVNYIFDTCIQETELDLAPLCNVVLSVYNELGDYESAIKLWQKMLQNEIVITHTFRKAFTSLLNVHKIPIPEGFSFSYPRHKQAR